MITSSTRPAAEGLLPPGPGGRSGPPPETEAGPAWHYLSECQTGVLARAFAELHQQTHGGSVNTCRRRPCAGLAGAIVPDEPGTMPRKTTPPDYAVHQVIALAVTDPVSAVGGGPLALPVNPETGLSPDPSADGTWLAAAALAALAAAGYRIVLADDLERLIETGSANRGFPPCEIIKAGPDTDFYVGWSSTVNGPVVAGTREEMLAADCPESRLRRADETGTSTRNPEDRHGWDVDGLVAGEDGWLPRANLAAYAVALAGDGDTDALALLRPYDDGTGKEAQP